MDLVDRFNDSYNPKMLESSLSQTSILSTLNEHEARRIMSVIERDFKLREKEYKRIE